MPYPFIPSALDDLLTHSGNLDNPHLTDFDKLADTTFVGPVSGDLAMYDGSTWRDTNFDELGMDLNNLVDMSVSSPVSGHFLQYQGGIWTNDTVIIDDIDDVTLAGLASGQVLTYNSTNSKWENQAIPGGVTLLSQLDDTLISGIASGDHLIFNGTDWLNERPAFDDGDDVDLSGAVSGDVTMYDGSSWSATSQSEMGLVDAINDLSDVTSAGEASGEVVFYNGSNYVNAKLHARDIDNVADDDELAAHTGNLDNPHGTTVDNLTDTTITSAVDGHVLQHDGSDWKNQLLSFVGLDVSQGSHGFVVGEPVFYNTAATGWQTAWAADQDKLASHVVGIVRDASNFVAVQMGKITGALGVNAAGWWYVSDSASGTLTTTEPTTAGHFSNPVGIAPTSGELWVFPYRANEV